MDIYAGIVRHAIHPLWVLKDGKWSLFRYLREFEEFQYRDPQAIKESQWSKLGRLIGHAYENCPFYRSRFDAAGLKPSSIQDPSGFRKIPLLTKKDIQESLPALVATNYNLSDLVANKTGGSTGSPLRYYHDRERIISMEASAIRHDRWTGYKVGEKMAGIWGSRTDLSGVRGWKGRIRNLLFRSGAVLDSSSITNESLAHFVEVLREFKPKSILAYANSVYVFAQYCREHGVTDIHPALIITSAEVLHDHERVLIEEVFGCKVFNRYGCREVSVIASECSAHTGLHINADTLYVEFVDDDGQAVSPGQQGNIIITDLLNFGMPFLRYKIEDVGSPSDTVCPCGRTLPLMQMVAGRTTDFIVTPDGRRVSGAALTIYLISNVSGIRQAQIIQDVLDHVTFKIVPGPEFKDSGLAALKQKVPDFFGKDMRFDITYVDSIPKEPSGKYRFTISKVGNQG